mmetsp:Transcript_28336/g.70376  ORF Transcript_28336/g.70376 Transcript_28336/m.70376 type:complete len:370 (-) Transcript_28336:86-1195(-)
MGEVVLKEHLDECVDPLVAHLSPCLRVGHLRGPLEEGDALDVALDEHVSAHVWRQWLGEKNIQLGVPREVVAERQKVLRLDAQVELHQKHLREFVHHPLGVEPPQPRELLQRLPKALQHANVLSNHLSHAWMDHLHRHLPRWRSLGVQPPPVHLRDAPAADRLSLERQPLAPSRAERRVERRERRPPRVRRRLVLQMREVAAHVLAEQVGPRGGPLRQLDHQRAGALGREDAVAPPQPAPAARAAQRPRDQQRGEEEAQVHDAADGGEQPDGGGGPLRDQTAPRRRRRRRRGGGGQGLCRQRGDARARRRAAIPSRAEQGAHHHADHSHAQRGERPDAQRTRRTEGEHRRAAHAAVDDERHPRARGAAK